MKTALKSFILFGLLMSSFLSNAQTWVNIPTPVTDNLILYDIRFPSQQNDTGFVAGSNYTYNGKGRVMKTTDGGLTWDIVYTSDTKNTGILAMDFINTSTGFAGTMGEELLITTDGGDNWTAVDIDITANQGEINVIEFFGIQKGILNTSSQGIYYTTNSGTSWTKASTHVFEVLDICYASETILFAVTKGQKIYKSTNEGVHWSLVFSGTKPGNYNLGVDFFDDQHGVVSSENGEIFITNDGGSNWSTVQFNQGGLLKDVFMKSVSNISICGVPGQVFESTDGGQTWGSDSSSWDLQRAFNKVIQTENGTEFVCGSGPTGGTILRKAVNLTGVQKQNVVEFQVSPNPVNNILNIHLVSENSRARITIVNLQGMVIWDNVINTANQNINTSNWVPGLYIITVKSGSHISKEKIIIL